MFVKAEHCHTGLETAEEVGKDRLADEQDL